MPNYSWKQSIGVRYGRLVVISKSEIKKQDKHIVVLCKCDCGGTTNSVLSDIKRGQITSCGCFQKEGASLRTKIHGLSHTKLYNVWYKMIDRCTNPNYRLWKDYGGRGIMVCDRWMNFENFYLDTISGYRKGLELDRYPNNDGNYEPTNFRWATRSQNCRNKRNNVLMTIDGITKPLIDWSEEYGIDYKCLHHRFVRSGMRDKESLFYNKPTTIHK